MSARVHLHNARFLIVSTLMLVSACVMGRSEVADDHPVAVSGKPAETAAANPDKTAASPEKAVSTPDKVVPKAEAKAASKAVAKASPAPTSKKSAKSPTVVKAERYVAVDSLNVRSRPSYTAPVVGKLTRGTMFAVSIHGEWARIGEGQFVLAKFLAAKEQKAARQGVAINR